MTVKYTKINAFKNEISGPDCFFLLTKIKHFSYVPSIQSKNLSLRSVFVVLRQNTNGFIPIGIICDLPIHILPNN